MLVVDISSIRDEKGASLEVGLSCAGSRLEAARDDIVYSGPVSVLAEVTSTGFSMVVRGEVKATLVSPCSRCLEPAELPLKAVLFEEYRQPGPQAESDSGLDADDGDTRTYSGNTLDLTDAVRDAIIMATPIRILCKDDCPGLCPMCGVNLGTSSCGCAAPVDPRLEGLAKLLRQ